MKWLALMDWSEQITNASLAALVKDVFPEVWSSLDVGNVARCDEKISYKISIEKQSLHDGVWDSMEWYGGVADKKDPSLKWESYLSIALDRRRELVICSSMDDLSFEKLLLFISKASMLGNLGYGYGGDRDRPGITYYIAGITYGMPRTAEDRRSANRLSRWFAEGISMGGQPPKKRYLHGMYRAAYPINVLNRSHIVETFQGEIVQKNMQGSKGELWACENETFIWSISKDDVVEANNDLDSLGLII